MNHKMVMTKQQALERVAMLDMDPIEKRLSKTNGFAKDRVDRSVRMYRKFLALLLMYPDMMFAPPSQDADEAWHNHILFTKKYHADCNALFGSYRHHTPMDGENPEMGTADVNIREMWKKHDMETSKIPKMRMPALDHM